MSVVAEHVADPPPAAVPRRGRAPGRRLRIGFGWAGVAIGLSGFVCRELPVTWQPAVLASTFSPYLAIGSVIGGALLVRHLRWLGTAVAALTVAATVAVHVPQFVGTPADVSTGAPLTVLQANLKLGTADPAAIVALIRQHDVGVVAFEELTYQEWTALANAGLDEVMPYHFARASGGGSGTGIWSRYPLADGRALDGFSLNTLRARVDVPGARPTTVFAVHLTPPWPYPTESWNRQIATLHAELTAAGKDGPVIAAGDYNSTWDQGRFRSLVTGGTRDAAEQVGAGWIPTYPANKPWPALITIDHVLLQQVSPSAVDTVSLPGSDHRGLLVRLVLPTAERGN